MTQQNRPNLAQKAINKVDEVYTKAINTNVVNRLEKSLTEAMNGGTKGNTKFVRLTKDMLNDINQVRIAQGKTPLTQRTTTAYMNAVNNHLTEHIKEYGNVRNIAQATFDTLTGSESIALPGSRKTQDRGSLVVGNDGRFNNSVVLGNTNDGGTSIKSISPRRSQEIKRLSQRKQELLKDNSVGGASPTSSSSNQPVGSTPISARQVTDTNSVSQNPTNVKQNQSKFSTDTATRSQELSDDFRTQLKSDSNNTSKSYEVVSDKTALENTAKFMDGKTLTEAESDITSRLNKKCLSYRQ